ncbi:MAG: Flp family type IVb pilin [Jiangellales bacterium]
MLARIRQHLKREEGASAVEYGLLVAGIAAVIVAAVFGLGRLVEGSFNDTVADIEAEQG